MLANFAFLMAGRGGPRVAITDQEVAASGAAPQSATYRLDNAGAARAIVGVSNVILENWITPTSAAGAAYEARATVVSGSLSSGTTGSWLSLGTTRDWNVSRGSVGLSTCILTIEIRRASDSVVIDSATITLSAEGI